MSLPALLDCDVHFSDHHEAAWADAPVPPALRPRLVDGPAGGQRLALGDLLFPRPDGPGRGNPSGIGHLVGPGELADRHAAAEGNGVAAYVFQPGFVGLSAHAVADPQARGALLDWYNRLVARAAAADERARWALLTTLEDLPEAKDEILRAAEDRRCVGVVTRPTGRHADIRWSDPALQPVLELLASLELTLFLHGGTGCYQWSPLADRFESYALTHAYGHMGEHMAALGELLCLVDPLPAGLRIVLLESGTSWLPPVVDRLESHRRRLDGGRTAWDAFREHFAVVADATEPEAARACERIGSGNVLFGSDYPHWDCVRADDYFEALPGISRSSVRRATAGFIPRFATEGAA